MNVTLETLTPFIGGQVEIQNARERYIYRGEIRDVDVRDGHMVLTLAWMARGHDFPPIPSRWTLESSPLFGARLESYRAQDIGSGSDGGHRLSLVNRSKGETIVLYPPDGSKLKKPE